MIGEGTEYSARRPKGFTPVVQNPVVTDANNTPLPQATESTPAKPFHGGFGDRVVHIVHGPWLGTRSKTDPTFVQQTWMDISNKEIRLMFADPTTYFKGAVGQERVAKGQNLIVMNARGGVVIFDLVTKRISNVMTPDQYAAETKASGGSPSNYLLLQQVEKYASHTYDIAIDAIQKALELLRSATVPKGTDPNILTTKIAVLKASLSQLIS